METNRGPERKKRKRSKKRTNDATGKAADAAIEIAVEEKNTVEEEKNAVEEEKNAVDEKNAVQEEKNAVQEEKNSVEKKKKKFCNKRTKPAVANGITARWGIRLERRPYWTKGPSYSGILYNRDLPINPRYKDVDIHVFDDFDYCRPKEFLSGKPYLKPSELEPLYLSSYQECYYGSLRRAMKNLGYCGKLIIHVAGCGETTNKYVTYAFKELGARYSLVNGDKDAADAWLLVEMTKWFEAVSEEPKICIVLSADQKAFWDALEEIYQAPDCKCFLSYMNPLTDVNDKLIGIRAEGLFNWASVRENSLEPIFWVPKTEID